MALRAVDQLALDETVIEDADLENALEERLRHRVISSEARRSFTEADTKAKGHIEGLELPAGGAVRCGRFRITRTNIPARSVAFETEASSRVSIALIEDESA